MELALQASLFEQAERRQLGNGAWVEVRSGWLADADSLFDELMSVIPWRAERRQMYDRVLDVPRLVSFHDLIDEPAPHPRLKQIRRRLNDTYGGSASRSPPPVCVCTATATTASPGTATPSAAAAPRTPWSPSSASARQGFSRCGRVAADLATTAAPPRRPAGDGRVVPAHLGALHPEDVQTDRIADQHPVPSATSAEPQPFTADTAAVSRSRARCVSTGATGLSGSTRGLAVTITRKLPKLAT